MTEPKKEIYEFQYMLRKIAQVTGDIPVIIPDGIYGEETRDVVRDIQRRNALAPTGEVDEQTWNAIFQLYQESIYSVSAGEPIYPFKDPSYNSEAGEKSDMIVLVQLILSALSVIYDDFEDIAITGVNDEKTIDAVKRFQGYNGLPQTGILNKRTWDAAAKNFNEYYDNVDYI